MNELRRLTAPARPKALPAVSELALQVEPTADCQRYDSLREGRHVH
jgi:hypothetical protein